jgi:hypothetical protein
MEIEYDRLKKIASEVRAELVMRGAIDIAKGKIRKKPRTREKEDLLFTMAIEKMMKYKPRNEDNKIVLPYFLSRK